MFGALKRVATEAKAQAEAFVRVFNHQRNINPVDAHHCPQCSSDTSPVSCTEWQHADVEQRGLGVVAAEMKDSMAEQVSVAFSLGLFTYIPICLPCSLTIASTCMTSFASVPVQFSEWQVSREQQMDYVKELPPSFVPVDVPGDPLRYVPVCV
jgi:hypothetical protein